MPGFTVLDTIDEGDLAILEKGLRDNAVAHDARPYTERLLSITHRDENGKLLAGLTGKTFWNWLYIDVLWVASELRGQGVGSALVEAAEAEARRRGCHAAYLWTESFEDADFYPRLGYKPFVVKEDFPTGHKRIGLMKKL
ncbi:MAG: GNAT family N-acetyltransferase [Alphaproteobacteria bacterium]|nr:GNAT family N-acetyltransferase [Alphaproteobacteria bacterium]